MYFSKKSGKEGHFHAPNKMLSGYEVKPHHHLDPHPITKRVKMISMLLLRLNLIHDEPTLIIVLIIEEEGSSEQIQIKTSQSLEENITTYGFPPRVIDLKLI